MRPAYPGFCRGSYEIEKIPVLTASVWGAWMTTFTSVILHGLSTDCPRVVLLPKRFPRLGRGPGRQCAARANHRTDPGAVGAAESLEPSVDAARADDARGLVIALWTSGSVVGRVARPRTVVSQSGAARATDKQQCTGHAGRRPRQRPPRRGRVARGRRGAHAARRLQKRGIAESEDDDA
jgi:hypothetical protein